METVKVRSNIGILKIELNDNEDYTVISTDDDTFFERFAEAYKTILEKAENLEKRYTDLEEKYKDNEMERIVQKIKEKRKFSESATEIIDHIFGEGTVSKYFRDIIEEVPGFVPSADCMLMFLEQVTPDIEKLFNKKLDEREKLSKARMAKYQPQDHKKPGGRK